MSINSVNNIQGMNDLSDLMKQQRTIPLDRAAMLPEDITNEKHKPESFATLLKDMVKDVNDLQSKAADKEKQFLRGEISDVHEVMIAAEEASVAFSLLMEIRNKLLDSYREIMRMQA